MTLFYVNTGRQFVALILLKVLHITSGTTKKIVEDLSSALNSLQCFPTGFCSETKIWDKSNKMKISLWVRTTIITSTLCIFYHNK